ncbi:MAG: phage minor capsid protein [Clostridia bacterium]
MQQNNYDIEKIFEEIENELISSMKRTLWSHKKDEETKGFDWPQWQALKLKHLEDFRKNNKDIFKKYNKDIDYATKKEMKKQFREGASRTNKGALKAGIIKKEDSQLSGSFFGLNDRKIKALMKSITNDINDVKYAALRMADDQYRQIIYKAEVFANTGAKTVKQAIDMATHDFLARGFNCIEYSNGSRHNIADYCDMAIRTANKRANLMGEGEMRKKLGNPLVYISRHNGACDKCSPWQGRVYIDDVYSGGTKEAGQYPLLSTAIEGGLFHPRCQHGSSTYYPDINDEPEEVTKAFNTEHEDEYTQALQRQKRQYERLALGSLLPENITNYQSKALELQNQIEGSTIEVNNLPSQFTTKNEIDNTNIALEFINNQKNANPKVVQLFKNINNNTKIPFKISHTKNYMLEIKRKSNNIDSVKLVIPNLTNRNIGNIQTWLHENMHFIDFIKSNKSMYDYQGFFSTKKISLQTAIRNSGSSMGKEIKDLFNKFNSQYEKEKNVILDKTNKLIKKLDDDYVKNIKGKTANEYAKIYKEYKKKYNQISNQYKIDIDIIGRDIMGGGVNQLQDIYDALSSGNYRDMGIVKYGHGSKYYNNINTKVKEIVANFSSLSISRPDLIEMLKKDKPKLVEELNNLIDEMLRE